jgi:hypothetical protein
MISTTYYPFSICNYFRVTAEAGDKVTYKEKDENSTISALFFEGSLTCVDSSNPEAIGYSYEPSKVLDKTYFTSTNTYEISTNTEWVCLHKNNDVERYTQLQSVETTSVIPSGWGFILVKGMITTSDNITVNVDNYYKPRSTDITLTNISNSTSTIILIK